MRKPCIFVLCIAALLLFSGCQPAPSPSSSRDHIAATGSSAVHDDAQPHTADTADASETTVIPECAAHITETISDERTTINIDADVIKPDTETLFYYTYQTVDADKTHAKKLIEMLWQDTAAVEYDSDLDRYDITPGGDDTFSLELKRYQIRLEGHGANLNPYADNAYTESCEVLSEYTNSEAEGICRDVYRSVCGKDSETLSVVSYGKTVGEKYSQITTAPVLNGLPVVDARTLNSFDFSDAGIYNAKLNCSEFYKAEPVKEIMPLYEAVEILRRSTNKIMIFSEPDEGELLGCTVDSNGVMTAINVNEVQLGYVFGSGNSAEIYPAWIFAPGKGFSDYSRCLAVNAVNGEVVQP